MASRKSSKNQTSTLSNILPRVVNSGLLFCVLANFLALAWSVRSVTPKQFHTTETVVTNHFFVVTQRVESVSMPLGGASARVEKASIEIPSQYHFMVVDGNPMIRFFGQTYKVGDMTSYGRVDSIFPDRVSLENGSIFLKNTINPDSVVTPKAVQNDRI